MTPAIGHPEEPAASGGEERATRHAARPRHPRE